MAVCYHLHCGQDDPLTSSAKMALANAVLCLLLSYPSGDYSWVDRLWSVVPCIYAVHFAKASAWDKRTTLMAVLNTLWGLRLTIQICLRKGYFKAGHQDYRWPVLQDIFKKFSPNYHKLLWELFNIGFIGFYQHFLLLVMALPSAVAY